MFLRFFRIFYKAALIIILTPILYLGFELACLLGLIIRKKQSDIRNSFLRIYSGFFFRVTGGTCEMNLPAVDGDYVLVSNHLSYVDIMLLFRFFNARFVSKAEVAGWVGIGYFASRMGTFFIKRENKKNLVSTQSEINNSLLDCNHLVFFPEGTSWKGSEVLPFKSPFFDIAAKNNLPVYCAAISYHTPKGTHHPESGICWWDDESVFKHARRFLELPSYHCRINFDPVPIHSDDRKELCKKSEEKVRSLFEPSGYLD